MSRKHTEHQCWLLASHVVQHGRGGVRSGWFRESNEREQPYERIKGGEVRGQVLSLSDGFASFSTGGSIYMYMYMCIYIDIHCMYTCLYIYIYIYVYSYLYMCICIYTLIKI